MEQNNNDSKKRVIDLLRILAEIQDANLKLTFASARELKGKADEVTGKVKKTVVEMAKPYGAKARKLAEDYIDGEKKAEEIKDFEARVHELTREYYSGLNKIMTERKSLEIKEYKLSLYLTELQERRSTIIANGKPRVDTFKKIHAERQELMKRTTTMLENSTPNLEENLEYITRELKRTKAAYEVAKEQVMRVHSGYETVNGKIQQAKVELQDIRRKIEATKRAEKKYKEDKECVLEEIETNSAWRKETIALMPKQNKVQRMLGSLFSRINGPHKFRETIAGRVGELTKKLPENVQGPIYTVTETVTQMASQARTMKYDMIDKAQATLDKKQAKLKEKGVHQKGTETYMKYPIPSEVENNTNEIEIIPDEEAYL